MHEPDFEFGHARQLSPLLTEERKKKMALLKYIRENIIGSHIDMTLHTIYGERPLMYADYTASAKSLRFIEEYI